VKKTKKRWPLKRSCRNNEGGDQELWDQRSRLEDGVVLEVKKGRAHLLRGGRLRESRGGEVWAVRLAQYIKNKKRTSRG